MSGPERVEAALDRLARDEAYRREYQSFVTAMSYAPDAAIPSFEQALAAARRLRNIL